MTKNIIFIGAGRLGTTLASALSQNNFSVPFFISKAYPKESKTHLPNTNFTYDLDGRLIENAEVVFITTPDDQIHVVDDQLSKLDVELTGKLVLHCSGCLSSGELRKVKSHGAFTGSLHPMQTFNDHFMPKDVFNGIVFTTEGDNQIIDFAGMIAKLLHARVIKLKPENKTLYHIAAVASSNFFVGLLDYVSRLYREAGFDKNEIKELVFPIVNQTLNNLLVNNSNQVLTGPLQRGDVNTIEKHVKYLKNNQTDLLPVYNEISKYILQFILDKKESGTNKLNGILQND